MFIRTHLRDLFQNLVTRLKNVSFSWEEFVYFYLSYKEDYVWFSFVSWPQGIASQIWHIIKAMLLTLVVQMFPFSIFLES